MPSSWTPAGLRATWRGLIESRRRTGIRSSRFRSRSTPALILEARSVHLRYGLLTPCPTLRPAVAGVIGRKDSVPHGLPIRKCRIRTDWIIAPCPGAPWTSRTADFQLAGSGEAMSLAPRDQDRHMGPRKGQWRRSNRTRVSWSLLPPPPAFGTNAAPHILASVLGPASKAHRLR